MLFQHLRVMCFQPSDAQYITWLYGHRTLRGIDRLILSSGTAGTATNCNTIAYSFRISQKTQKNSFTKSVEPVSFIGMRPKRFARIGDILPAVLKSAGLEQKLRDQEILTIWPAVVGEEIAARTKAVRIANGVLYVQVVHSVWLQELYFMEKDILRKLKEQAPRIDCRRIRLSASP